MEGRVIRMDGRMSFRGGKWVGGLEMEEGNEIEGLGLGGSG